MDGVGNHQPQQTNAGMENQTPYVLTYKWELNDENTWTHAEQQHTLGPAGQRAWGKGEYQVRRLGRDTWGELPDIGDGGW